VNRTQVKALLELSQEQSQLLNYLLLREESHFTIYEMKNFRNLIQDVFMDLRTLWDKELLDISYDENGVYIVTLNKKKHRFDIEEWNSLILNAFYKQLFLNDLSDIETLKKNVRHLTNINDPLLSIKQPNTSIKKDNLDLQIKASILVDYLYKSLEDKGILKGFYLDSSTRVKECLILKDIFIQFPQNSIDDFKQAINWFTSHTQFWNKIIINSRALKKHMSKALIHLQAVQDNGMNFV
jgi:hypothetical protein